MHDLQDSLKTKFFSKGHRSDGANYLRIFKLACNYKPNWYEKFPVVLLIHKKFSKKHSF